MTAVTIPASKSILKEAYTITISAMQLQDPTTY